MRVITSLIALYLIAVLVGSVCALDEEDVKSPLSSQSKLPPGGGWVLVGDTMDSKVHTVYHSIPHHWPYRFTFVHVTQGDYCPETENANRGGSVPLTLVAPTDCWTFSCPPEPIQCVLTSVFNEEPPLTVSAETSDGLTVVCDFEPLSTGKARPAAGRYSLEVKESRSGETLHQWPVALGIQPYAVETVERIFVALGEEPNTKRLSSAPALGSVEVIEKLSVLADKLQSTDVSMVFILPSFTTPSAKKEIAAFERWLSILPQLTPTKFNTYVLLYEGLNRAVVGMVSALNVALQHVMDSTNPQEIGKDIYNLLVRASQFKPATVHRKIASHFTFSGLDDVTALVHTAPGQLIAVKMHDDDDPKKVIVDVRSSDENCAPSYDWNDDQLLITTPSVNCSFQVNLQSHKRMKWHLYTVTVNTDLAESEPFTLDLANVLSLRRTRYSGEDLARLVQIAPYDYDIVTTTKLSNSDHRSCLHRYQFNDTWNCSEEEKLPNDIVTSQWKLEEVSGAESGLTEWNLNKFPVPPFCIDVHLSDSLVMRGSQCTHFGMYGSAIGGDFDADGFVDLLLLKQDGDSKLLRNTVSEYLAGSGDHEQSMFSDVTAQMFPEPGVQLPSKYATMGFFVDIDHDGGLDLLVASDERMFLFMYCLESGTYCREEAVQRGLAVLSPYRHNIITITAGDVDNDGLVDIYVGEWMTTSNKDPYYSVPHTRLLHHVVVAGKKGYFEDITALSGIDPQILVNRSFFDMPEGVYTLSSAFIDLDLDGWRDLVLAIDFGMSTVYWNNGDLTFTEQTIDFYPAEEGPISREENGMGLTFHDLNKDGLMDILLTSIYDELEIGKRCVGDLACNVGWSGNRVFLNKGNRRFADYTDHYGLRKTAWGWSVEVADLDNSGIPEILILNGFEDASTTQTNAFASSPNYLFVAHPIPDALPPMDFTYVNEGPERGFSATQKSLGLCMLDVDNDGDLDAVMGVNVGPMILYRNNYVETSQRCLRNRFLRVKVEAAGGTPLLGAQVVLWEREVDRDLLGSREAYRSAQWQEIGATIGHWTSESEMVAHFGVGAASSVDRVRVTMQNQTVDFLHVPTDSMLVVQFNVDFLRTDNYKEYDMRLSSFFCPAGVAGFGRERVSTTTTEELLHMNIPPSKLMGNKDLRIHFGNVIEESEAEKLNRVPQSEDTEETALDRYIELAVRRYKEGNPFPTYKHNGKGNNLKHPEWDHTGWLWRKLPAAYEDGMHLPSGSGRASPRLISNELADQTAPVPSRSGLSTIAMDWGQFLAHDLTLANPLVNMKSSSGFPIPVPKGDLWFDPDNTGTATIRFTRTNYDTESGTDASNPRRQINRQTPHIDGSNVYGNHGVRADDLREHSGGRMRISEENLIPQTNSNQDCDNPLGRQRGTLFLAGDHRANEQPGLFALHTVFIREHNRIAEKIERMHPELSDDEIYAITRTVIITELQIISYEEYLPALLGNGPFLPQCDAYDEDVRADVFNAFATAAFRFGHSGVPVGLHLFEAKEEGSTEYTELRSYDLHHTYFRPEFIRKHGVEPFLLGQSYCACEEIDMLFITDLRNLLFGTVNSGGMDLCSLNIQRGRDHGLCDYNTAREYYGLPKVKSFLELAGNDPSLAAKLSLLFPSVDDVDLLVGGLLEPHPEGSSLGELFSLMMKDQFEHLCKGDRLFYKWVLDADLREELERETSLAAVINRNTMLRLDTSETVFRSKAAC